MGQKIYLLLPGWKKYVALNVVHIYGAGKYYEALCLLVCPNYIYRSVHNIRIERLWVDVTNGIGQKWKEFFQTLEAYDNLNVNNDSHLWLLHFLFLPLINDDVGQWVASWNHHVLGRRGEPHQSPHDLFIQGVIEHGHRGVFIESGEDQGVEDIASYGIDWNDLDDRRIRAHHDTRNPEDSDSTNPFVSNHPDSDLSHVEVPESRCPFADAQLRSFLSDVQPLLDSSLHIDMHSRRLLWIQALALASFTSRTEPSDT
jgi:hypothetical protein